MASTIEETQEPVKRRDRSRRWVWLWGWAPLVVVLVVAFVRYYDRIPGTYALTARYDLSWDPYYHLSISSDQFSPLAYARENVGVLMHLTDDRFVFFDQDGKQCWDVKPDKTGKNKAYLSPSGHVCVVVVRTDNEWVVDTWRDGNRIGVAHVPFSGSESYSVCCADDGSAYLSSGRVYLIRGDALVAMSAYLGKYYTEVSADGHTLFYSKDTPFYDQGVFCDVQVKGETLTLTDAAPTPYDGRFGMVGGEKRMRFGDQPAGGPFPTSSQWESHCEGRERFALTSPASKAAPSQMIVTDRQTKATWSFTMPDYRSRYLTDDGRHVLVGRGSAGIMDGFLSLGPTRWDINLDLYNRYGVCEASLSDRQLGKIMNSSPGKRAFQSFDVYTASSDGQRLVAFQGGLLFLHVVPHKTVWELVTGMFRKGK